MRHLILGFASPLLSPLYLYLNLGENIDLFLILISIFSDHLFKKHRRAQLGPIAALVLFLFLFKDIHLFGHSNQFIRNADSLFKVCLGNIHLLS